MSTVYATEPSPSGRVIVETASHGPLDIQLFCRECPTTTRLFMQLCLDGYYDDMLFHRIVPNFLIQTGAIRRREEISLKQKQEEEKRKRMMREYRRAVKADYALERRRFEVHSRLQFNHRGQVAMALTSTTTEEGDGDGDDDEQTQSLQLQFFVTLDEASNLNGRHVIFGTCTGPTFFNALRMGQLELELNGNNMNDWEDAPRIERIRVVDHQIFPDLVANSTLSIPWKMQNSNNKQQQQQQKKKKRKGKLDKNVLSFGDEMMAAEGEDEQQFKKGLPQNKQKKEAPTKKEIKRAEEDGDDKNNNIVDNVKPSQSTMQSAESTTRTSMLHPDEDKNAETTSSPLPPHFLEKQSPPSQGDHSEANRDHPNDANNNNNNNNIDPATTNASTRTTTNTKTIPTTAGSLVEARRAKYLQNKNKNNQSSSARGGGLAVSDHKKQREETTMARLLAFQSKVVAAAISTDATTSAEKEDANNNNKEDDGLASRMARRAQQQQQQQQNQTQNQAATSTTSTHYYGQVLETDHDDEATDKKQDSWMTTRFKCRKHIDHDSMNAAAGSTSTLGGDGRNMDDYLVVDDRASSAGKNNKNDSNKRHKKKHDRHDRVEHHRNHNHQHHHHYHDRHDSRGNASR